MPLVRSNRARPVFADVMKELRGQHSLITTPIITVPTLTIGFSLSGHNQLLNEFISMFSYSCR
jgi:hypothetical protein